MVEPTSATLPHGPRRPRARVRALENPPPAPPDKPSSREWSRGRRALSDAARSIRVVPNQVRRDGRPSAALRRTTTSRPKLTRTSDAHHRSRPLRSRSTSSAARRWRGGAGGRARRRAQVKRWGGRASNARRAQIDGRRLDVLRDHLFGARTRPTTSSRLLAWNSSPTRSSASRAWRPDPDCPRGSTPLDFAYAVHTSIGTRAARASTAALSPSMLRGGRATSARSSAAGRRAGGRVGGEGGLGEGARRDAVASTTRSDAATSSRKSRPLLLGRARDSRYRAGCSRSATPTHDGDGDADGGASYPRSGAAVTASAATAPAAARGGVGAAGGGATRRGSSPICGCCASRARCRRRRPRRRRVRRRTMCSL